MKRAKIFSLTILFGLFLFSSSILAQEKEKVKITITKRVKIKKSKLDLIKANPNYRIISKKDFYKRTVHVTEKKKQLSVIDALKEEFKK